MLGEIYIIRTVRDSLQFVVKGMNGEPLAYSRAISAEYLQSLIQADGEISITLYDNDELKEFK